MRLSCFKGQHFYPKEGLCRDGALEFPCEEPWEWDVWTKCLKDEPPTTKKLVKVVLFTWVWSLVMILSHLKTVNMATEVLRIKSSRKVFHSCFLVWMFPKLYRNSWNCEAQTGGRNLKMPSVLDHFSSIAECTVWPHHLDPGRHLHSFTSAPCSSRCFAVQAGKMGCRSKLWPRMCFKKEWNLQESVCQEFLQVCRIPHRWFM